MDLIKEITNREQEWKHGLILSFDDSNPIESIRFFETEILSGLKPTNSLSLVFDQKAYQKINLHSNKAQYAGVFYNLHSVSIAKGGIFHPKLYLLVAEEAIHIVVGSCNLTPSGLKRNLESFISIDLVKEELDQGDRVFIACIAGFLKKAFIEENGLVLESSVGLSEAIGEILTCRIFQSRITSPNTEKLYDAYFLSSVEESLWDQVVSITGDKIKTIEVVSPFYDNNLNCFEYIKDFSENIKIFVPEDKNTFPSEAFLKSKDLWNHFHFFGTRKTDTGINRFIHSKFLRIESSNGMWGFVTSANFTSAGLFSGNLGTRNANTTKNFEIGVLFKLQEPAELDPTTQFEISKIVDPADFKCQWKPLESDSSTNEYEYTDNGISSAYFDGNEIQIILNNPAPPLSGENTIELYVNQILIETHVINQHVPNYRFTPGMDFENSDSVRVRFSKNKDSQQSPFVIVNRQHHSVNSLPTLSAGAYGRCLELGGEEGVEEAFQLAKKSGRDDWLYYLLSHWPLDRILIGRQEDNTESDPGSVIIPGNLAGRKRSLRLVSIRKNIEIRIDQKYLWENVTSFVEEIERIDTGTVALVDRYAKYCLPIFTEIAFDQKIGIGREEEKYRRDPNIDYRNGYRWLNYYRAYENKAKYMFRKLFDLTSKKDIKKMTSSGNYETVFWIWLWVFLQVHTEQTIKRLISETRGFQTNFQRFRGLIRNYAEQIYCDSTQEESAEYEEILSHYAVSIEFQFSFEL